MKKLTIMLASLGMAAAALPATANAQNWVSINQRQTNLSARIDQGVRSGALNLTEAYRLKGDLRALAGLEANYRRSGGGLDLRERADLDRRFDGLSKRVYVNKHDRQHR